MATMQSPPPSSDHGDEAFDPSTPFQDVVVCCTSIPVEQRSDIASKTAELGGVHKYDLTPDVTHLIVGDYDTAKYRHVAKERPDIKAMAVGWVDAVRSLWVEDKEIDFRSLEKEWCLKTFETGGGVLDEGGQLGGTNKLLCCLTGFDDATDRQGIIERVRSNGGNYTGDLSRHVTHLIVHKPQGKKYKAAREWKVRVVALKWVDDSVQRGMILDETCYDPLLPEEDLGKGAWNKREVRRTSLGKRQRDATKKEEGRRKLRKTASMKLTSQRENMWGEILGQHASVEQSASRQTEDPTQPQPPLNNSMLRQPGELEVSRVSDSMDRGRTSFCAAENKGDTVFASCLFYVFGFPEPQTEMLVNTVSSLGGTVSPTLRDVTSIEDMAHRFVIVPQTSNPKSHPPLPDGVDLITECFIEKCLYKKMLLDPSDHVIGRPFPVFPIEGFDKLSVCTGGFTDVDLLQVDRSIRQLGARFEERFNAQCSLLLCTSLGAVRKQKLDLAHLWKIPVIKADWLWECISHGKEIPLQGFLFSELNAKASSEKAQPAKALNRSKSASDMSKHFTPKSLPERAEKSGRASLPGPDISAFDTTPLVPKQPTAPAFRGKTSTRGGSNDIADFETAPTHQSKEEPGSQRPLSRPASRSEADPLSEKSASDLNKTDAKESSQSQPRKPLARVRSEVCDSEAGDDECIYDPGDGELAAQDAAEAAADAAELEKRRLKQEKQEKAAAERLALSNKLTTLLEGTAAGAAPSVGTNSFDSGVSHTAIGNDDGSISKPPAPPLPRRKRNIMGRAISNVSAASSGSADSSVGAGGGGIARTHSMVIREDDSPGEEDEAGMGLPTATQIEYDDPEATRSKARLMSKMLGRGSAGAGAGTSGKLSGSTNKRITMGGVVKRDHDGADERVAGARSMRRR